MISNMGFDEGYITLYVSEGTNIGDTVTVTENNTCAKAVDGVKFCGILKGARKNIGSVQIKGCMELSYTGSAPALGVNNLSANGVGGVKEDAAGITVTVTAVDTVAATVQFIM